MLLLSKKRDTLQIQVFSYEEAVYRLAKLSFKFTLIEIYF